MSCQQKWQNDTAGRIDSSLYPSTLNTAHTQQGIANNATSFTQLVDPATHHFSNMLIELLAASQLKAYINPK